MQVFLDTFHKQIHPDDILVLGVSGGVDSMVLLHLVLENHKKENIIVAHFDHSLRGDESDTDSEFIANICNSEKITFELKKMSIETMAKAEKMSIETMARRERYSFLEVVRQKYNARYILTAHHSDDRIETAIFNLIRGSKLGGIHALDGLKGAIFRPLISTPKSEILEYANIHQVRFREDSTNTDTSYLRNHIRHSLLPQFMKINPEYQKTLQEFIDYTKDLKEWVDTDIQTWLRDNQSADFSDNKKHLSFDVPSFEGK